MKFLEHNAEKDKIVEVVSNKVIINNEQDALDLIAIAGKITERSKSLNAFIEECNRTKQVIFTDDVTTALNKLTK